MEVPRSKLPTSELYPVCLDEVSHGHVNRTAHFVRSHEASRSLLITHHYSFNDLAIASGLICPRKLTVLP
jgi:hypothetical protein